MSNDDFIKLDYTFLLNPRTGCVVALGSPPDSEWDEDSPLSHNCDAMGCGSTGAHIIARFYIPIGEIARLTGGAGGDAP